MSLPVGSHGQAVGWQGCAKNNWWWHGWLAWKCYWSKKVCLPEQWQSSAWGYRLEPLKPVDLSVWIDCQIWKWSGICTYLTDYGCLCQGCESSMPHDRNLWLDAPRSSTAKASWVAKQIGSVDTLPALFQSFFDIQSQMTKTVSVDSSRFTQNLPSVHILTYFGGFTYKTTSQNWLRPI